jgi:trehalose-phosphatase
MIVKAAGLTYPKHVSEEVDLLARALGSASEVHLFLDYGGTLLPSRRDADARPDPGVLTRIKELCEVESCSVFVVSGRTIGELESATGIPALGYVGQRGFEIRKPDGPIVHPVDPGPAANLLHHIELDAHRCVGACSRVEIENKGFGIAMHLGCDEPSAARAATRCFVDLVRGLDVNRQLELFYGDDLVEARMAGWHKGDAVGHILHDADPVTDLAVYIGDDVTDEDAFEAISTWAEDPAADTPWFVPEVDEEEDIPHALSILVAPEPRPTMASMFVRGPQEVHEFLSSLSAIASTLL